MKARLPNGVEVEGTSEEVADLLKNLPFFVPIQEFTFDPPGIIDPGVTIIGPGTIDFGQHWRTPSWGLNQIISGEDFTKLMSISAAPRPE